MEVTDFGVTLSHIDIKKAIITYILDNDLSLKGRIYKDMWIMVESEKGAKTVEFNDNLSAIVNAEEKEEK